MSRIRGIEAKLISVQKENALQAMQAMEQRKNKPIIIKNSDGYDTMDCKGNAESKLLL